MQTPDSSKENSQRQGSSASAEKSDTTPCQVEESTRFFEVMNLKSAVAESVRGWVWVHNAFLIFTLSLYTVNLLWLAHFYLNLDQVADFSPTFRWSMVALVTTVFALTNIVLRTHGTLFSQVDRAGLMMLFACLSVLIAISPTFIPAASALVFVVYVLTRKGNRRRLIVLLTIIMLSIGAIICSPWFTNIIYQGFFGGILSGAGTAYLIRLLRTYQSGGVFNKEFQKRWKTYEMLRDEANTFDVILESESESPASRLTSLWSRSPWTHAAMVVESPPDSVLTLYGIPTQDKARAIILDLESKLEQIPENESSDAADKKRRRLAKKLHKARVIADETLFVYEAVRPVVNLTSLKLWMEDKESNDKAKIFGLVPLQMYNGYAKVDLNLKGLTDLMIEMHGTKFVDDPKFMVRANYQMNRNKDVNQVFCSELVALMYQRVGLLSEDRDAANFTPSDWVPNTTGIEKVRLLVDATLGDTVRIRERPPTDIKS